MQRFEMLLQLLSIEEKWGNIIADWLDSDIEANFPSGAEDSVYTSLTPSYRTANMPITRTSELLALTEFGLERYQKLEPFVTALPIGVGINLCTASPELLDALIGEGRAIHTGDREGTVETRKQRCFPNKTGVRAVAQRAARSQQLEQAKTVGEKSSNFRSTIWVTIGTTQYTLYSLLYRANGTKLVRPILRSHGTP